MSQLEQKTFALNIHVIGISISSKYGTSYGNPNNSIWITLHGNFPIFLPVSENCQGYRPLQGERREHLLRGTGSCPHLVCWTATAGCSGCRFPSSHRTARASLRRPSWYDPTIFGTVLTNMDGTNMPKRHFRLHLFHMASLPLLTVNENP